MKLGTVVDLDPNVKYPMGTHLKTAPITNDFTTPALPVRRCVLQCDCLSALIQFVCQEKYMQLGFSTHDKIDWFQIADDAAVISTNEQENQRILNCFTKWCHWSNMIIRVGKCVIFRIKYFLHDVSNMNQNYLLILNLYPWLNLVNHLNTLVDTTTKSLRRN